MDDTVFQIQNKMVFYCDPNNPDFAKVEVVHGDLANDDLFKVTIHSPQPLFPFEPDYKYLAGVILLDENTAIIGSYDARIDGSYHFASYELGGIFEPFRKRFIIDVQNSMLIMGKVLDADIARYYYQQGRMVTRITSAYVIQKVCEYYELTRDQLLYGGKEKEIVYARYVAMFLLKTRAFKSYPVIGRDFGGFDHTTVMYGCKKIKQMVLDKNADLLTDLYYLDRRLRQDSGISGSGIRHQKNSLTKDKETCCAK